MMSSKKSTIKDQEFTNYENELMKKYTEQAKSAKKLNPLEEKEYIALIQKQEAIQENSEQPSNDIIKEAIHAREKMVEGYLYLIVSICQKYQNCGLPAKDLITLGKQGLIKAAQCFEESIALKTGIQFANYAAWHIEQYILRKIHAPNILLPVTQ